jgi:hypothetical protein
MEKVAAIEKSIITWKQIQERAINAAGWKYAQKHIVALESALNTILDSVISEE